MPDARRPYLYSNQKASGGRNVVETTSQRRPTIAPWSYEEDYIPGCYFTVSLIPALLILMLLSIVSTDLFGNAYFPILFISGVVASLALFLQGYSKRATMDQKYQFLGLSRRQITRGIEYIDACISEPNDLDPIVPYAESKPHASYHMDQLKGGFTLLVLAIGDMVRWPAQTADIVKGFVKEEKDWIRLLGGISLCLAVAFIAAAGALFEIPDMTVQLSIAPFLTLIGIVILVQSPRSLLKFYRNALYRKVDSLIGDTECTLEDSMSEIFRLLQREYRHPLYFLVCRHYPELDYSGETETSYNLIRLKRAVLNPLND
jgi:hypothetical protein